MKLIVVRTDFSKMSPKAGEEHAALARISEGQKITFSNKDRIKNS